MFAPDFTATANDSIKPSFYIPAGSTRQFAARRLRDHAEVSGNSPDKAHTNWSSLSGWHKSSNCCSRGKQIDTYAITAYGTSLCHADNGNASRPSRSPVYQQIYQANRACFGATDYDTSKTIANPLLWFSGTTAPNPPSDIHGDGFTLLTETKLRFDGYGIADDTASYNAAGGHRIQLETGTNYNTAFHFPDPAEVGAYQIVIQPNLFSKQLMGNNENTVFASTDAPKDPGGTNATVRTLTDQLFATVVAMKNRDLILSEATMADVRGCEIYLNEVILDIDPSTREQFTNIPMLGLSNPFGVNATSSSAFTRRSLPYHPNMFHRSTPGHTVTVPWWSVALASSTIFSATAPWKGSQIHHPDDYYLFCRSTLGAVGTQTTMLGYPSHYLDVYTEYLTSLTPVATVEHGDQSNNKLYVRNNNLFPVAGADYYAQHLVIVDADGVEQTASYEDRGYIGGLGANGPVVFNAVTAITSGFGMRLFKVLLFVSNPSSTISVLVKFTPTPKERRYAQLTTTAVGDARHQQSTFTRRVSMLVAL